MDKPTVKTVTLERWSCGIDGHRHLTERVATECIKKQSKMIGPMKPKRTHEEVMVFVNRRDSGEKWLTIAADMGISIERARQVIKKHKMMNKHEMRKL